MNLVMNLLNGRCRVAVDELCRYMHTCNGHGRILVGQECVVYSVTSS